MNKKGRIQAIIHSASVAAGSVGGGLAQIPGSDMPILCSIQAGMIMAVALEHGAEISKSAAMDLIVTYGAGYGGRALSQLLIGWMPGWGNALNAATATSITEAVGWYADSFFQNK